MVGLARYLVVFLEAYQIPSDICPWRLSDWAEDDGVPWDDQGSRKAYERYHGSRVFNVEAWMRIRCAAGTGSRGFLHARKIVEISC